MNIKTAIKKAMTIVFAKRPVHTTANVVELAPNELLKGRTALITGGTSGIGFAIAKAFLQSGANVIITGRSEERLEKAIIKLQTSVNKGNVSSLVMDNADISSFELKFHEMLTNANMGGADILVNNAGVLGASFPNAKEEDYDKVLDTNLKGVFFLSQIIAKHWVKNKVKGNILNIASSSSLRPATSAYVISKWGIRGLTLGLAKSLAPYGITVNGIAPGPTATPMLIKDDSNNIALEKNPTGRYVIPEEIANMAVMLVSDMGRMIVGDIIYMTGGAGLFTYDDINYDLFSDIK